VISEVVEMLSVDLYLGITVLEPVSRVDPVNYCGFIVSVWETFVRVAKITGERY